MMKYLYSISNIDFTDFVSLGFPKEQKWSLLDWSNPSPAGRRLALGGQHKPHRPKVGPIHLQTFPCLN